MAEKDTVLSIKNLKKIYKSDSNYFFKKDYVKVIDKFDLEVKRGECVGISGESGSGKTTVVKCILNLEEPDEGEIIIDNETVFDSSKKINLFKDKKKSFNIRKKIQLIMQDPGSALDSKLRIGKLLEYTLKNYNPDYESKQIKKEINDTFKLCGLGENVYDKYPYQLSGGQKQRVCIARALILNPEILICDEITASLDISLQKKILELLQSLKEKLKIAIIFISHDRKVVSKFCDRICYIS
ncbi:MAG: ABC transporter ATP-binding protein [Pseudoleptotrichia goodfellowii]|nr:ABC transporter ATP-binding protein [Pseudoleptotrichia goodfellowii]